MKYIKNSIFNFTPSLPEILLIKYTLAYTLSATVKDNNNIATVTLM